jgi:hypothetical protein
MAKQQKDKQKEKLAESTAANIDYIRLKKIEDIIKNDVKKDIKAWVWRPIAVLLTIGAFFSVTTYTGIKTAQKAIIDEARKNFKEDVNTLYKEANVSVMVNTLIKENAENMIKEKVAEEINPIITDLKEDQNEYSKTLNEFKKEQAKYAEITLLNELSIKAINGDKNAFITLANSIQHLDLNHSQFAKDTIRGAYEKYFGNRISYDYYKPIISDEEVIKNLDDENFITRKLAVGSIRQRKMYKQIPDLISRIKTETHLDVIGEIERTLNALLGMDIRSFDLEEATNAFMKTWESKKMSY